ncbi:glutathione peroxidase 7-like, partial [Argonauta hians]
LSLYIYIYPSISIYLSLSLSIYSISIYLSLSLNIYPPLSLSLSLSITTITNITTNNMIKLPPPPPPPLQPPLQPLLQPLQLPQLRKTTLVVTIVVVVATVLGGLIGKAQGSNSQTVADQPGSDRSDSSDGGGGGELKNFYSFTVKDIAGQTIHLSKYIGKVSLVVNLASECGYTHRNYEALVQLQSTLRKSPFTVLGFPCNQFGKQEPGDDWEIESFAEKLYKVNFPLFAKTEVVGSNAAPCWKYLTKSSNQEPDWNFWKYLVDGKGHVINVWSPKTSFSEIYRTIRDVLETSQKPRHTDL